MRDIGNLSNKQLELRRAAIKAINEHGSARAAAEALDTNHGIILMARDGKDTPAAYRALGVRKTDTSTVAFHFKDHDLAARFRALIDGHEGGRYAWARRAVEVEATFGRE